MNFWKKALIHISATVGDAIFNLNQSQLKIALVVSPDNTLLGTLSDGDLRRGLLRGMDANSPIDGVFFKEPLVVPRDLPREAVIQIMQTNKIQQVPIIDEKRRVIGLHVLDRMMISDERNNLMVIMAGGQGTRLRPSTENCPKPLLPVKGKPILEHIIMQAKAEGFFHFALAVQYLPHMIEEYFGDGKRWDVQIDYLREEEPLGTAGAISLLNPRPEAPFLVSNGDVLTNICYGGLLDFHCSHKASATMAVALHEWQNPFGVVHTDGIDITVFEEKPITRSHVNAGVYALEPGVLDVLGLGEHCDMPMLFGRLQEKGHRTIVYPTHESWMDLGDGDDLKRAQSMKCLPKF
jgi:dTDP-glucose pyrophosphorylase